MIKSQCSRASLGLLISAAISDAIYPPAPCFTNGEAELASLDLERRIPFDQAYRGQRTVIREHAPKARDFTKGQTITLWLNYLALPSDSRTRPASVLGSSAMASRITTRGAT
jgi:hypothetical protein